MSLETKLACLEHIWCKTKENGTISVLNESVWKMIIILFFKMGDI